MKSYIPHIYEYPKTDLFCSIFHKKNQTFLAMLRINFKFSSTLLYFRTLARSGPFLDPKL